VPHQSAFNVLDYRANPDGKTVCTKQLQAAIDACGDAGGGTVHFPPGTYLSGTLTLRSHVGLHLESGATLLGSPNQADFPIRKAKLDTRTNYYNLRSLIFAEELDGISITGKGAIDGNGEHWKDKRHDGNRPLNIRIISCRDVLISDVTIGNSGFWNQHYIGCERVRVTGVRVWNHATYNVDAIDIDACRDFIVSDCIFDSDDDALCLKSTMNRPCENVVISNCIISSHCNAIKFGTDSTGGFKDVTISNCSIVAPRGSQVLYGLQRGISGIALEIVDGGTMERIAISNITIDGVEVPLFVRLGARGVGMFPTKEERDRHHDVGKIQGVKFSNIVATRAGKTGCSISGVLGHEVEDIALSHVSISSEGGGLPAWSQVEPKEQVDLYPEGTMFGRLPSHGLFCRHVRGLVLDDVTFTTDSPDPRSALVLDDVHEARIQGLTGASVSEPLVDLRHCQEVVFQGCIPRGPFLKIQGGESAEIKLIANDLTRATAVAVFGDDVPSRALKSVGNLEK
jgi:hypothetical protein